MILQSNGVVTGDDVTVENMIKAMFDVKFICGVIPGPIKLTREQFDKLMKDVESITVLRPDPKCVQNSFHGVPIEIVIAGDTLNAGDFEGKQHEQ